MGIFTRFRDIISSNINVMLDRAEDPEKLIKLMIREMEDTLVELKASCAGVLAERKRILRQLEEFKSRKAHWEERVILAVNKSRDDLAREALKEKRRFVRATETLEQETIGHGAIVDQYKDDIQQLEEKLITAREKQRLLVQRHLQARNKKRAQEDIRRMDNHETVARFDDFEHRIERMEAEADLVNYGRKTTLEEKFDNLLESDDIEKELAALKSSKSDSGATSAK